MNLNRLAASVAAKMSDELTLDVAKMDTLRFGLEIIFCSLVKGTVLFGLAYFFDILPEVLFASVCGSLYRLVSGGAHCTEYLRCLVLGLIIYLGAGELGLYLKSSVSVDLLIYLLLAGCIFSSYCVIAWAPGEVPYKTISKVKERRLFKTLSLAYLFVWLGISVLLLIYAGRSLVIAGLIAVIIQTFSFSPLGNRAIHFWDGFLAYLSKERRC